ncbi:murein biosynthesis integral membrane protein MurJ [bacterium]|nr:murein biosynthesis integral membrane protein MurJ [bacterium]
MEEIVAKEEEAKQPTKQVARAALITTSLILLARIVGFIREIVIAKLFGASRLVDIYVAAFTIPDILFFLLSGGALSSAFVPVYTQYLTENKKEEANRIFSSLLNILFLALLFMIGLAEIFAHSLVHMVVPHFPPQDLAYCVFLTRLMLPSVMFFILGGIFMGVAYCHQEFFIPTLSGVIYNLFIILGGLFLGPSLKVTGLSIGVVAGSFIGNFLIQLWYILRIGEKPTLAFDYRHPGVRKVFLIMLPIIFTLSVSQLTVVINRVLASGLGAGAIAGLNYANRLNQFPLGIFGQALGIAVFPTLSVLATERRLQELKRMNSLAIRTLFFLNIPSALLFILFGVPIVQFVYQRGAFTYQDTLMTAQILAFYSIGLPALSATQIANRTFYSFQDSTTPLLCGVVSVVICAILNILFVGPFGVRGLAFATSISAYINLFLLLWFLRPLLGGIEGKKLALSFIKITVICLIATLPFYFLFPPNHFAHKGMRGAVFEIAVILFAITPLYLFLSSLFHLEEWEFIKGSLIKRVSKR